MNKFKILLASAIVFYLLRYEEYALILVTDFMFDISVLAMKYYEGSTFSILWRVYVSIALVFLLIFPLVTCLVSMILRISTENIRYVFLILTISYTLFSIASPFIFDKPTTLHYYIARTICALSMAFTTYGSFTLKDADVEAQKGA